jgi:hypothetical protein
MRSVGSLGGWVEGGSKGAGRQHTRILYIHTHERSMHACVPHSLHNSPHILHEMQMRLYEILRDSAPVRGGSAVGNRRFGSTNHPRNAPLFFDHLYFPNCISIFHAIFPKKSVFVNKHFLEFIVKKRKKDLHVGQFRSNCKALALEKHIPHIHTHHWSMQSCNPHSSHTSAHILSEIQLRCS